MNNQGLSVPFFIFFLLLNLAYNQGNQSSSIVPVVPFLLLDEYLSSYLGLYLKGYITVQSLFLIPPKNLILEYADFHLVQ